MSKLPRTAALIVNTKSRRGQAAFREACRLLKGAGVELTIAKAVRNPAKMPEEVRKAVVAGVPMVIVGGGDGSISSTVDHVVGTKTIFAILPLGTANSFARTLGIPLDLEGAVEVIRSGRLKRIDLGMIDSDYFANCAAIGISPQIAETVPHKLKRYLGRAGYLGWAALQYARFKPFTLIVDDGREVKRLTALEVRISNGRFQGGTELVDAARVDSGEIVVQAVTGHFKRRLLKNWGASVMRLDARHDDTVDFKNKSLKIATEPPLPISIDGEVLAKTPVTAHIAAGVIEVMVPAGQG